MGAWGWHRGGESILPLILAPRHGGAAENELQDMGEIGWTCYCNTDIDMDMDGIDMDMDMGETSFYPMMPRVISVSNRPGARACKLAMEANSKA
ncbi:hypothetical protein BU24DRAFT_420992 [Aaosphaeria arxii CBS 175.79]|uniref:Uncharacterized protein n=1 Tax=Aaosphaeria arxii CBS 175.79 TaxID=1450172 RepID=A0A6A5XXS7_9PLEO|nr:uncharacterized protein BU24DRAFT_420992 [Aaosphaeria arxii CBS 175.79]KAF2017962.1 hypothetical protein BU24DRAFT_420992 [Aaosphaeria arxii CBS 175.79]